MATEMLEDSLVPRVSTFLAEAMHDDPAYAYLMPDPIERGDGLRDYFARSLRTHLPYRCTYLAVDGGVASATVTVRPPEGIRISTLTMIRRGLLPFALAHGKTAIQRLFALKKTYDLLEARLSAGRPHWWVHMMAVEPSRQSRGIGIALLEGALAMTAGARGSERHPILLTTHKERNVVFYRRAGFEVVDVQQVALEGAPPYRVWGMRRV
jgi:GNAT superfamily N-acetyltransferase